MDRAVEVWITETRRRNPDWDRCADPFRDVSRSFAGQMRDEIRLLKLAKHP